jgi:hypothetical protein
MFKQIIEFIGNLLFLYRNTQENTEAIAQLRVQMQELAKTVDELSFEIRRVGDRKKLEREKLILQLENALLRIERRLPKSSKN